jgi:hypothetical protein
LRSWPTPLDRISHLANQVVTHCGERLILSLQNLATLEVHEFTFHSVLAFRFSVAHNMRRLGSTFTVENSSWLREHELAPMRARRLDGVVHYMFSSNDGEFEILCYGPPLYTLQPTAKPSARRKRSPGRQQT